jgi:hypothetical protein
MGKRRGIIQEWPDLRIGAGTADMTFDRKKVLQKYEDSGWKKGRKLSINFKRF